MAVLVALVSFLAACSPAPKAVPAGRVLVVGADGLEWSVLRPLLAQGKCPNLRALMERGSFGHLGTMTPTLSPILWTTIATGQMPERHGIQGFTDADTQQYTSASRRVRAVWNVTSLHDVPTNVFGWWITWPAEELCGTMVSGASATALVDVNWKPSILPDVPDQVFPAERTAEVMEIVKRASSDAEVARLAQRIFGAQDADLGPKEKELVQQTAWSIAADATYAEVACAMMKAHPAALNLVYFGGTDVVAHRFWRYYEPSAFQWPARPDTEALWQKAAPGSKPLAELLGGPRAASALARAIPNYYEWFDELLGKLIASAGPDVNVVVISDHGFHAFSTEAPNAKLITGHHLDGPPGVIVAAGPSFARQDGVEAFVKGTNVVPHGNVLSIMPTLLALMGIPSSREFPERALGDLLTGAAHEHGALELVPSHDAGFRPAKKLDVSPAMEQAFRERFGSLGYIGLDDAGTETPRLVDPKRFDPGAKPPDKE
ncbi:MAG: alkaline phosphatase family protein [Planctomycetes bacterium]|nr:alkaline phosphatase family protein [Planctomycetota bacterium]